VDEAAIVVAVGRFLQAWKTATTNDDTLSLSSPVVVDVHEAARDLIRATGARDLVGAYAVLDALVLDTR
jgi:hypothetical protein